MNAPNTLRQIERLYTMVQKVIVVINSAIFIGRTQVSSNIPFAFMQSDNLIKGNLLHYSKNIKGIHQGLAIALLIPFVSQAETAPPQAQPAPTPPAQNQAPQEQANPAQAKTENKEKFDIWEYRIMGNSVLSPYIIQKSVYPYLGPHRNIDDVEKARSTLEALYHEQGYQTVFVNIPEQDVLGGLVKLEVVEGKVDQFKITGSRYFSLGKIKESVPALAEGQVPHMPSVEKQLSALSNQSTDRQISPILRPGDRPGTFNAELKVKDELPVHGSLEMNGRNTVGTTYSRLLATLRYDNLWQLHHSASLQYLVAPESQDVEVWSGTYAMPLTFLNSDAKLAFYGVGVNSNSAVAAAGALGVLGTGEVFGLRLNQPLPSFPGISGFFHNVSFGVDYKHFVQGVRLETNRTDNSPITYLPFTVGYSGGLRRDDSFTSYGMEGHVSIEGLVSNQQEFTNRRFLATANYFYFSADVKHQQKLPYDLGLMIRAAGQVASGPLINNEQFSAGGAYSVRGYHETQELADEGVMGSLELHSPSLAPAEWEFARDLRALAFLDGAQLWTLDALPGTPSSVALAGTGIGMRLAFWGHVFGELDWAFPLLRVGSNGTGAGNGGSNSVGPGNQRIHFRLAYEF